MKVKKKFTVRTCHDKPKMASAFCVVVLEEFDTPLKLHTFKFN